MVFDYFSIIIVFGIYYITEHYFELDEFIINLLVTLVLLLFIIIDIIDVVVLQFIWYWAIVWSIEEIINWHYEIGRKLLLYYLFDIIAIGIYWYIGNITIGHWCIIVVLLVTVGGWYSGIIVVVLLQYYYWK